MANPWGTSWLSSWANSWVSAVPGTSGLTVTVTLYDINNRILPNLSNLVVAWWDDPELTTQGAATMTFSGKTTDSAGVMTVSIDDSTLSSGDTGRIKIVSEDGSYIAGGRVTVH